MAALPSAETITGAAPACWVSASTRSLAARAAPTSAGSERRAVGAADHDNQRSAVAAGELAGQGVDLG